jgi:hypothetical protein
MEIKTIEDKYQTSLLEDLDNLVGDYQRDKISKEEVIDVLENIVKYERRKKRDKTKKQEWVKPTICKSEIKYCDKGKFFYAKWSENVGMLKGEQYIMAKHTFDEVCYGLEKQGYDILNEDGSLFDYREGA